MSDVNTLVLASLIVFVSLSINIILFYLCIKLNRRVTDSLTKFLDTHTKIIKSLGGILYEKTK